MLDPSDPKIAEKWLEEQGPDFQKIYDTYSPEQKKQILNEFYNGAKRTQEYRDKLKTQGPTVSASWYGNGMGTMGDALVTLDNGSSSFHWGHAGIVADDPTYVYEANPGEGVQRKDNYWYIFYNDKHALYVSGASNTNYWNAQNFGWVQWVNHKGYELNPLKWDESNFYCSKLVWCAWKHQGYDIDNTPNDSYVLPVDILLDDDTVAY